MGVSQAKRSWAQVFPEDPILLPEILDQIGLVAVHPASEREDEELQRAGHALKLLRRLDQHRPDLGRLNAPYAVGVRVLRTPRQAPNCNAHAERFVLSIKSECLNRMMFFGEASLRRAVGEYLQHYHRERPHQGRGNETLDVAPRSTEGALRCRERLGGLLKHYARAA